MARQQRAAESPETASNGCRRTAAPAAQDHVLPDGTPAGAGTALEISPSKPGSVMVARSPLPLETDCQGRGFVRFVSFAAACSGLEGRSSHTHRKTSTWRSGGRRP